MISGPQMLHGHVNGPFILSCKTRKDRGC
jgi:hypothetical protein